MTDLGMPAVPASDAADEAVMTEWAERLVAQARAEGVELADDGGLLTGLLRQVLQTGLEAGMAEHLGHERHAAEGRGSGNSRNGSTPKRVTTEIGEVDLAVPRDRAGTFEPATVPTPSSCCAWRLRAIRRGCVVGLRWRLRRWLRQRGWARGAWPSR